MSQGDGIASLPPSLPPSCYSLFNIYFHWSSARFIIIGSVIFNLISGHELPFVLMGDNPITATAHVRTPRAPDLRHLVSLIHLRRLR